VGIAFFLLASAALATGFLFKETALLVFGPLFLTILAYCLGACLVVAAVYRKRAAALGTDFAPSAIAQGEQTTVLLTGTAKRFRTPPAILARYMVRLKTLDGRTLEKVFPRRFFTEKNAALTGEQRGAYFAPHDYLLICDIFGFFRVPVKIPGRPGERLLVYPTARRETPLDAKNAGGSERAVQNARTPSDDLIEQRQYVPGDDPRRINWKLYGHSEELFVREGEKWGEPLSEIIIVIDSGLSPMRYNRKKKKGEATGRSRPRGEVSPSLRPLTPVDMSTPLARPYIPPFESSASPSAGSAPQRPRPHDLILKNIHKPEIPNNHRREAVDRLCGRALEIALAAARTASSVTVYYRGCGETGRRWTQDRDKRALYALFALPFAATDRTAILPAAGLPRLDNSEGGSPQRAFIVVKDEPDQE
jgi:hypothetical protein